MSTKHLALAAEITGLSPTCKLLLFGLAHFTNPQGLAVATNVELQAATGLSERAVRINLRHLERLDVVRRAEQPPSCWEWLR